jgi:anti-sigma B factor antagonist
MKITVRQIGNVTIITPEGKITIGDGDVALRTSVREALENGSSNLLLNLGNVTTIDSSGIGELVSSYTSTSSRGGKLKLSNLPAKVTDILHITQLITVFEVYDNEKEALDSF